MARQAQMQTGNGNGLRTVNQVSLSLAKKIADAAEQKSRDIGVQSVITVADPHGNKILQRRMDNAWLPSVSISEEKAYTAAGFEAPTNAIDGEPGSGTTDDPNYQTATAGEEGNEGPLSTEPEGPLWGLHTTDDGNLVIFGGGFPLIYNGEVVGAIGASGGTVEQDEIVGTAGVNRFENLVSGVSNGGGSGMNNEPVGPPDGS